MAMLTLGSVGDLGATPATAVLGLASVVIYVLPAIVFLLPASLVSAELASGWPGGVHKWVSQGISPRMGFVAVWCQFVQTTFYHPALLAYVASTLAYVVSPSLASNGLYTTVVIIGLFWDSDASPRRATSRRSSPRAFSSASSRRSCSTSCAGQGWKRDSGA